MSFDELRVKVGRRPITVVELDLDFCGNTYGSSPCTAAVGTTGTAKCFNTFKTCQDTANFTRESKTYRFASESPLLPIGEQIFPCIKSVDIAPTQLNPRGFSVSASVTVTLKDFPHHDRGVDPYQAERTYSPQGQGTFFGRLRARNPFIVNRVMRVNTGYVGADGAIYSKTRTYFIERMEGPDASGNVRIIGKDPLRFADAEKREAPVTSKGSLSANLSNSATSLTLVPAGIGDDYPTSGTVRIEDELVTFSGRSGDTLPGLTRGTDGTTADAHDAATTVQLCIRYTDQTVPAILNDLLTTYAGIPSGYIPLADWETEAGLWLGTFDCSAILSDPKGVKELIEEVIESTGCALWWDEEAAKIRFKVIVPLTPDNVVPVLDETSHILAGSMRVQDLEKERISRVVVYMSPISQVADVRRSNFRTVVVSADLVGEGENSYGVPSTREILSRWVPTEQLAVELGERLLKRYRETPRQITFRLDAKDALKVGDLFDLQSRLVQAPDGTPAPVRFLVLEAREVEVGTHSEYVALQVSVTSAGRVALIADEEIPDWEAASDEEKGLYMFISDAAGLMSDLQPGPVIS